jgi:hypothetical protein
LFNEKKRDPNDAVLNKTVDLLLPLDVRGKGRSIFFFPLFSSIFILSLSLLNIKKMPTITPLA